MTEDKRRVREDFKEQLARIQRQMLKEKLDLTKRKEKND
jgi:hypothetical protein